MIGDTEDEENYIVTDKAQIKRIKKSRKKKEIVPLGEVNSAILLPNGKVIDSMGDSVTRSNSDGGFHEEGGRYGLDASGSQVSVAAAPGPYVNPKDGIPPSINTEIPADSADLGRIIQLQGTFHVHPAGQIIEGPQSSIGSVLIMGGKTSIYDFKQPPSDPDLQNAKLRPGVTNFVIGARTGRVYIYNQTGNLTPTGIPLGNFLKIGGN
jgi:hypothetical protein